MSGPAIEIDGVGKRYRLGAQQAGYKTLRETIMRLVRAPFTTRASRGGEGNGPGRREPFWALRDVTFQVPRHEILGVIGRNGAGKTTLLKILSGVTEPTEGEARLYGRVGALLEVGTGFHPELTGRENIYLNGAILGMKRAEIARRFDAIVAFAEVEKFIDTPAKHYSSGMFMRLAFSVAAHLEPDILLVDEVLAVGDAAFQKKCIGKMEEVGRSGRTVVFVSHSMPSVLRLCRRAILLDDGRVVRDGTPHEVVADYLRIGSGSSGEQVWPDVASAPGDESARLHSVRVLDVNGAVIDAVDIRSEVAIEVRFWHLKGAHRPSVMLQLFNDDGVCLFTTHDLQGAGGEREPRRGLCRSVCRIPGNLLAESRIIVRYVSVSTHEPMEVHAWALDPVSFQIIDHSRGDGARGQLVNDIPGVMRPLLQWELDDE